LWSGRGRTTALEAAWVNGTLAHALDFDDGGVALTPMHPSSPVLAAVWALCESQNLSAMDALSAYVVGLEVECKIASAISLSHYDHGWHATAVIGVLGAVGGTSWLARLNADQTRNAIGIAASLAGGLQANFGTMTKPLHAGIACRNGLVATLLAKAGWTANPAILEADNGFFKVFGCGEIKDLNSFGKPFHFYHREFHSSASPLAPPPTSASRPFWRSSAITHSLQIKSKVSSAASTLYRFRRCGKSWKYEPRKRLASAFTLPRRWFCSTGPSS